MRTQTFFIQAVLVLGLMWAASTTAESLKGYGKSEWGMTIEQVRKAEAARIKDLTEPQVFKNTVAYLTIEELPIGIYKFDAVYQFNKETKKLTGVLLSALGEENHSQHQRIFQSVEELLITKYGEPSYRLKGEKVTWNQGATVIQLEHFYIPQMMSKVSINYKQAEVIKSASENL